ncbi:MAG: hypothetical protein ACR2QX_08470 [Woeseiaceae bacterium]
MMRMIPIVCAMSAAMLLLFDPIPVYAQSSAAELLEQARARSRDLEELKGVLNGPDQNMRLATFDVMVNSGDDAMRQVAIDLGLASADPLLQAMAFKETVLGLNRIVFTLELDTSQPETVQQKARAYMNANGASYDFPIAKVDKKTGIFTIKSSHTGQVNGTTLTFKRGYDTGALELIDETTIKGTIKTYKGGFGGFIATAKIR